MSSRHLSRSIAMQSLYEWDFGEFKGDLEQIIDKNLKEFGPGLKDDSFVYALVKGVVEHLEELNEIIEKAAPQWPLEQISRVNRNVLRLGLYELLYADRKEVPPKVAINEAIELAKNFGNKTSGAFVNGVLGTVYKEIPKVEKEITEKTGEKKKEEGKQERKAEKGGQEQDKKKKMDKEILAGGVIYRRQKDKYQLALILDPFGYWTFPKGHVEEKETLTQALEREIEEEIGLKELRIIKKIGEREYIANDPEKDKVKRNVSDFLVEAVGKTELKMEESTGVRDARWFSLEEIEDLKRYQDADYALKEAISFLKEPKE